MQLSPRSSAARKSAVDANAGPLAAAFAAAAIEMARKDAEVASATSPVPAPNSASNATSPLSTRGLVVVGEVPLVDDEEAIDGELVACSPKEGREGDICMGETLARETFACARETFACARETLEITLKRVKDMSR